MVLTLSMNADAAAQKHRHTPRTEQVDSTKNKDAIEAFSDTTASSNLDDETSYSAHIDADEEDIRTLKEVMETVGGVAVPGMAFAVVAIVIMFLLAPLLIIITIFYFVNKNRREKYKLAQMAIQNGQPIPNEILNEQKEFVSQKGEYNAGIRQMFTGIGLGIFLGIIIGDLGWGIGALVFFIGLGKWFIARQSRNNDGGFVNNGNNNNSNLNNYE